MDSMRTFPPFSSFSSSRSVSFMKFIGYTFNFFYSFDSYGVSGSWKRFVFCLVDKKVLEKKK